MTEIYIALDELFPGQDADPPLNARKTGRYDDIEPLAASIEAHGMMQALNVQQQDGVWYTVDGSRRLSAQKMRAEKWGTIAPNEPIKCDDAPVKVEAIETSVALNYERVPLHEADMYETFHALSDRGATEEAIAQRFGIDAARVRRMLALGKLSPVILEAWRTGAFHDNAVGCVRAFTLGLPADQEKVFRQLRKDNRLYPTYIRDAFVSSREAVKALRTCGREIYLQSGGTIIEDLFDETNIVLSDPALAIRLATESIDAAVRTLALEGWSWTDRADKLAPNWHVLWTRLEPGKAKPNKKERDRIAALEAIINRPGGSLTEKGMAAERELAEINEAVAQRVWSDEAKAKAGAVVATNYQGEIVITRGVMSPAVARKQAQEQEKTERQEARKAAAAAAEKAAYGGENVVTTTTVPVSEFEDDVTVSDALAYRLATQATNGMRTAITMAATVEESEHVGLCVLLAGFISGWRGKSPVKVNEEGMGFRNRFDFDKVAEPFEDCLARLLKMDDPQLFKIAAGIAADALDLTPAGTFDSAPHAALADALPALIVNEAMLQAFDPGDYFQTSPKANTLQAVTEAINSDEARKLKTALKSEMVAFAMKDVLPTRWLPAELRTSHYDGPSMDKPAPGRTTEGATNG